MGGENGVLLEAIPLFARELIAGGAAKTIVAPLERLKILFQTRSEFYNSGVLASFKRIAKTEGLLGFYRGNGASVVRIVPYAALHYMTSEEYKRHIGYNYPGMGNGPVADLVAGSLSGVMDPRISNAKVGEHAAFKGIRDCFTRTYKQAGMRGLYRGVVPSLVGIFPYAGLKFYFYEEMKRQVPDDYKNHVSVKLGCGSVAGPFGQTFTYPLDVVRRQMQVQQLMTLNSSGSKGTFGTLFMIIQKQGWKHLFSGLGMNYLKVVPSVAIGFTVYETMKGYLRVPERNKATFEEAKNKGESQT